VIPTVLSVLVALTANSFKNGLRVEILELRLEVASNYVQKGSLDKEITELKGLISKLSSQISDLQREFDRSHQGEI
jgi:hypothetical protein